MFILWVDYRNPEKLETFLEGESQVEMCYEFLTLKDKLYEPINKEVHQIVRVCMVGNWMLLFVNRRISSLLK